MKGDPLHKQKQNCDIQQHDQFWKRTGKFNLVFKLNMIMQNLKFYPCYYIHTYQITGLSYLRFSIYTLICHTPKA